MLGFLTAAHLAAFPFDTAAWSTIAGIDQASGRARNSCDCYGRGPCWDLLFAEVLARDPTITFADLGHQRLVA